MFNKVMGFPIGGARKACERNFTFKDFWMSITTKYSHEARRAKATLISYMLFRYIQRILACTIFG